MILDLIENLRQTYSKIDIDPFQFSIGGLKPEAWISILLLSQNLRNDNFILVNCTHNKQPSPKGFFTEENSELEINACMLG